MREKTKTKLYARFTANTSEYVDALKELDSLADTFPDVVKDFVNSPSFADDAVVITDCSTTTELIATFQPSNFLSGYMTALRSLKRLMPHVN